MRRRGIIVGGMILSLLLGCNNGLADLEKKNSFYESVVKIGHEFQGIFGVFGDAIGDALGFSAVTPEDNRSKVGEHFKNLGDGLKNTKEQLEELSKKIASTPNADIKGVEAVVSSASEVLAKLMTVIANLAGVTKGASDIGIGANHTSAVGANETDVKEVSKNINEIIEIAKKSGVEIKLGNPGKPVTNGDANAGAAIAKTSSAAANAGPKLAEEVSKADPWAMIDKIKDAKVVVLAASDVNEAGALATKKDAYANTGAKTNADLAAAVALKAMTKDGKFSAHSGEVEAVKGASASAVNKVLGVLDEIIRKTVSSHLGKVREAVKGIKYSEATGEATEVKK